MTIGVRMPSDRTHWRGPLAMVAAMACWSGNDALVKLCTEQLSTGLLLAVRGAFALALSLLLLCICREAVSWRALLRPAVAVRCTLEVATAVCATEALARAPLAVVTALAMLSPLLATLGSEVLGWERRTWPGLARVVLGLTGAILAIEPWAVERPSPWGVAAALGCAACMAARDLLSRHLAMAVSPRALTAATMLTVCIAGAVATLASPGGWISPTTHTTWLLAGAAVCATVGNLLVMDALRSADLGLVMPFRFTLLLWAALLGGLIWRQTPTAPAAAGLLVIAVAGIGAMRAASRGRR